MYGQSLLLITTSRSISSCFCSFSSTVERILWRINNTNTFAHIVFTVHCLRHYSLCSKTSLQFKAKIKPAFWTDYWSVSISRSPWLPWSALWVCGPSCWQSHKPRDQSPRGLSDPPRWSRSAAPERSSASLMTQYCASADALWKRTEDETRLDEVKNEAELRGKYQEGQRERTEHGGREYSLRWLCHLRLLICKKFRKELIWECWKENFSIIHRSVTFKPTDRWNE